MSANERNRRPGYPGLLVIEGGLTRLEFHPIANAFPLMEGDAFRELVEDVRKNGQQQPILTYEGKILDGRNRYRACLEAGEEPWTEPWAGTSAVEAVLSLNLHRRHLSSSDRAVIAESMLPHLKAEARKRQGRRTDLTSGNKFPQVEEGEATSGNKLPKVGADDKRAISEAARLTGTNRRYVQEAARLKEEEPETFEKIKRGEVGLSPFVNPKKPEPAPKFERPEPTIGELVGDDFTPPPRNLTAEQNSFYETHKHVMKLRKMDPEKQAAEWLEVKDDVSIGPHIADAEYAERYYASLKAALQTLEKQHRRATGNLRVVGGEDG